MNSEDTFSAVQPSKPKAPAWASINDAATDTFVDRPNSFAAFAVNNPHNSPGLTTVEP